MSWLLSERGPPRAAPQPSVPSLLDCQAGRRWHASQLVAAGRDSDVPGRSPRCAGAKETLRRNRPPARVAAVTPKVAAPPQTSTTPIFLARLCLLPAPMILILLLLRWKEVTLPGARILLSTGWLDAPVLGRQLDRGPDFERAPTPPQPRAPGGDTERDVRLLKGDTRMRKRRMWSCTTFLGVAAAEAKVVRPASVAVGPSSDHPLDPQPPLPTRLLVQSSPSRRLLVLAWYPERISFSPKSTLGSAGPLALAVSEPRTEPDEPNPISPPLLASFSLLLANPPISPHPTPPGPATPLFASPSLARRWETPHPPPPRRSRGQSPRSRPLSITRPLIPTTRPPSRARSLPVGQERFRQPKGPRATVRASRAVRRRAKAGRRASTASRRAHHLPRQPTTAPTATTEACPSGTAARTRARAR